MKSVERYFNYFIYLWRCWCVTSRERVSKIGSCNEVAGEYKYWSLNAIHSVQSNGDARVSEFNRKL